MRHFVPCSSPVFLSIRQKQGLTCSTLQNPTSMTQRDYSSTFIVSMPSRSRQPISNGVKWQIIGLKRSGLTHTDIANQFGVGQSDVSRILSQHRQTGSTKDGPQQGRPQKDKCARAQGPGSDGNTEHDQVQLSACQGMGASPPHSTVQIHNQSSAICHRDSQRAAQKPSSTACQAQKGINEESRFWLYQVDGRVRVWQRHGLDYNQDCVQPRPQAFGRSVMIWGMTSYEHKTPLTTVHGNLTGTGYRDEILDVTVRPHFQQFQAEQPIFMNDNARLHRECFVNAYKVQHRFPAVAIHESWLKPNRACVGYLSEGCKCPSTPCDHCTRAGHGPASRVELDAPKTCGNLVQSMSSRCQPVLQAHQGHTYYCCSCHTSVNILMKVTLSKMMICHETSLLPHLFWFKDFLLMSFLLSKRGIFQCFVSYALLLNKLFTRVMCLCICSCQGIIVVVMWTFFCRESKFSQFLFPKKFGTLRIANMQQFCSGGFISPTFYPKFLIYNSNMVVWLLVVNDINCPHHRA